MTTPNTNMAIERIEKHLFSPTMMAKFVGVLDKSAAPYIRSVMIAVEADPKLQKCTPESIGVSALRAASLQLSCDPAVKQAYLVPYWNGKKQVSEAQFQPHYLGLYALAVRTNKYSVINVTPFPADYSMELDLSSGEYVILSGDGKIAAFAPKVKPQDAGAWYGYIRTTRNFSKKIWMTKEEIHEHAQKFNPKGYNAPDSLWKNPNQVHTMEMKTVLRELLNWADKSGYGDNTLREALKTEEVIETEVIDLDVKPEAEATSADVVEGEVKTQEPVVTEETKVSDTTPAVMVPALGEWAVGQAAQYWNISKSDAAKAIGKKYTGQVSKAEFLNWLKEPQTA